MANQKSLTKNILIGVGLLATAGLGYFGFKYLTGKKSGGSDGGSGGGVGTRSETIVVPTVVRASAKKPLSAATIQALTKPVLPSTTAIQISHKDDGGIVQPSAPSGSLTNPVVPGGEAHLDGQSSVFQKPTDIDRISHRGTEVY